MALSNGIESLTKSLSGLGVDEKTLISTLGKWQPEDATSFRKGSHFFSVDERNFEKWDQFYVKQLKHESLRFKSAFVLWTMHPWERDARLIRDAVLDGAKSYNVIVEIASTRSSEELLGARKAYHSLFDRSIEEDLTCHVDGIELKLLVALVSAYRYEGPKVHEATSKSEAKKLHAAITGKKSLLEGDDEVVALLSTRSNLHLKELFKHYKEISGKNVDEDLVHNSTLKDAVQCLSYPTSYFIKVLDAAMDHGADENTKEGLIRVLVTRADIDMKVIKHEYLKKHGFTLTEKVQHVAKGNFKDFLLALLARSD